MSKPKNHIPGIIETLTDYSDRRVLDFHQYSPYHLRITDGGYVAVDVWTTGRYFIVTTDYAEMTDGNEIERGGEKGNIPINDVEGFLDKIFFPGA